jgi:hypothetical protein
VRLEYRLLGIGAVITVIGGLLASNVWHVGGIAVMMVGAVFILAARWMTTSKS